MRKMSPCLLIKVLGKPVTISSLSLQDWDLLVRQARSAKLLAHLSLTCRFCGVFDSVPEQARKHLESAELMAEHQNRGMRFELTKLNEAFEHSNITPTILKGAAYLAAGLAISRGRTFSDIDLLVQESELSTAEKFLNIHGWKAVKTDEYDDHYYRTWMHELPPMKHMLRGTVVDLHHSILPRTARTKITIDLLFKSLQTSTSHSNLQVFSPEDMFIHSATHLFTDGELNSGLRDLVDLHFLIDQFLTTDDAWSSLVERSLQLGLSAYTILGVRYAAAILGSKVPQSVLNALALHPGTPNKLTLALLDYCYLRALLPIHPSCTGVSVTVARLAVYVRAHWLRMPMRLLLPHLWKKTIRKKT